MAAELIGIGYWRNLLEPQLPDVACFVDNSWPEAERQTTLQYLEQGQALHYWMGMQRCLLGCGKYLHTTGYTDGTYYWPESLLHYVAVHAVRLPDEFMQYIHQQQAFPTKAATTISGSMPDCSWWKDQKGWHSDASFIQYYLSKAEAQNFLRNYYREHIAYSGLTSPDDEAALDWMLVEVRQLASQ